MVGFLSYGVLSMRKWVFPFEMGVKWGKRILVRVCPPPARSGDRCVFEDNGVFSKSIVWFSGLQRHFAGENALFSFEIGVFFFGEKKRDFQLKLMFSAQIGYFR